MAGEILGISWEYLKVSLTAMSRSGEPSYHIYSCHQKMADSVHFGEANEPSTNVFASTVLVVVSWKTQVDGWPIWPFKTQVSL